MIYPAKDLYEHYKDTFTCTYDSAIPIESVAFMTITNAPKFYEYGASGAAAQTTIVQIRIFTKRHEDLLNKINQFNEDLDGKCIVLNEHEYEVFVTNTSFGGTLTKDTGHLRTSVMTIVLHY